MVLSEVTGPYSFMSFRNVPSKLLALSSWEDLPFPWAITKKMSWDRGHILPLALQDGFNQ